MVTIRNSQMDSFGDDMFERALLEHVNQFFPDHCAAVGPEQLREVVLSGVQAAKNYGLTEAPDVCQYIDLMFIFGRDFDTNPDFPWAKQILTDESLQDASQKISRLTEAAGTFLQSAQQGDAPAQ